MEPLRDTRNRLLNGWQLSKLYTFEVAARHQSFALAADELSLSPSAVSHVSINWKPSWESSYLSALTVKWSLPMKANGYSGR